MKKLIFYSYKEYKKNKNHKLPSMFSILHLFRCNETGAILCFLHRDSLKNKNEVLQKFDYSSVYNYSTQIELSYLKALEALAVDENDKCFEDIKSCLGSCQICGSRYRNKSRNEMYHVNEIVFQCRECIKNDNDTEFLKMLKLQREKNTVEKRKSTCIEKYGVTNPNKTESVKAKIKNTNLSRRGVENVFMDESIKEKSKQTRLINLGVEHALQSDAVQEKRKQTLINKSSDDKVFGPNNLLKKLNEKCYFSSLEDFCKNSINEIDNGITLIELAIKYNISYSVIKQNEHLKPIRDYYWGLNPKSSIAEETLLFYLNKYLPTLNFQRHKRQNDFLENAHRELDFISIESNVAIEFNGYYWHNKLQKSDLNKARLTREAGNKFLALNEVDLISEFRLEKILNTINTDKISIGARECTIKELTSMETKDFLEKNHIQGYKPAKINLGLIYNDKLIQLMTFSSPRFSKKYSWELLRLATDNKYVVLGGSKKLWNYFKNNYLNKNEAVVSYCDVRYFSGKIYEDLGFNYKSHSFSYIWKKNDQILERYQTQKHKLYNLLGSSFDSEISETENMIANGWAKINLLGNDTWVYYS